MMVTASDTVGSRPARRAPPASPYSFKNRLVLAIRHNGAGYLFLSPWLIGFFGLTLIPTLASLYLSFTDYDLLTPPRWSGVANYDYAFFQDERFRTTLVGQMRQHKEGGGKRDAPAAPSGGDEVRQHIAAVGHLLAAPDACREEEIRCQDCGVRRPSVVRPARNRHVARECPDDRRKDARGRAEEEP